jgi:hypothetical protein
VSATVRRLLLVLTLGLLGCSYSPNPNPVSSHTGSIAIPVFQNRTTQPVLEEEVTTAIVNRIIQGSKLRVVPEGQADLVVTGAVVGYKNSVFGFNATEKAEEYQVAVTLAITVRDRTKNREVWRDDQLVRTANYFVVQVGTQAPQTEEEGRASAVDKLAEAVLNKTVETW